MNGNGRCIKVCTHWRLDFEKHREPSSTCSREYFYRPWIVASGLGMLDCPEIRRQCVPCTGTPADGDRDCRARCPFRYGNPNLGLSADAGCPGQPGSQTGT